MKEIAQEYYLYMALPFIYLLGWLCMDWGHNWDDDFALYIEQSQAILDGTLWQLYEQNKYAMDHSGATTGPYLYPNGFPLLLCPVMAIFGLNWYALKLYCFSFFVFSLPLIYSLLLQLKVTKNQALLTTLLVGFSYHFIRFGDWIYSDLPFFFFCLLSLYLALKNWHKWYAFVGLGFCFFFTYLIRDIGLVLLPFFVVVQWQKGAMKKGSFYLVYLIFFALFFGSKITWPSGGENHIELLQNVGWESIRTNIILYYKLVGNFFLIYRPVPMVLQSVFSGLMLVLFGVGWMQLEQKRSLTVFCVAYLSVCLIWPSFQGMRMVFVLMPFLMLGVLLGLEYLFGKKVKWIYTILCLMTLLQTAVTTWHYYRKDTNEIATKEMHSIYDFITQELPSKSIIIHHKPRTIRLMSGVNAVQIPTELTNYKLIPSHKKAAGKILLETKNYKLILQE